MLYFFFLHIFVNKKNPLFPRLFRTFPDVRCSVLRCICTGASDAVAIEADLHVETFLEAILVRDRALLCERQLHAMLAEDAVRRLQCVLDNAALMEIIVIAPRKSNACICSFCLLL